MDPDHRSTAVRLAWPILALPSGRSTGLQAPTVDDLVRRHTAGAGGCAAIEAVQTISLDLRIVEPRSVVDAVYVADRQGRMRIDVYRGGQRVYTEAYVGREAWVLRGGATQSDAASATATAALRHGVQLPGKVLGLHELRGRGIRVDWVGREVVERTNYYVLKLTFPDRFATHLYLNPATFLIERRRDLRALHPDLDPSIKWLETRYSDFRAVGGTVHAFKDREIGVRTGTVLSSTDVQSLRVNVSVAAATFVRPQ